MITSAIIEVLSLPVMFILDLIPDMPATPVFIVDIGEYLIGLVSAFTSVAAFIYGDTLLTAILILAVALMLFDQIWGLAMFIAKKIPVLNIK